MRIKGLSLAVGAWCILHAASSCIGPDIGESIDTVSSQNSGSTSSATSLPAPTILLPVVGYRTTSNLLRFQTDDNPAATGAEVEVYQGATLIQSASVTTGVAQLTLPPSSVGSFTIRARNVNSGNYSGYSSSIAFTIEDYASAPVLYNQAYNTASPGCGDTTEPFGVRFFFCNADPHWNALCTGASSGGGNVWICDSADIMGANNSGSGIYSAVNATFDAYNAPDGAVTGTGYLQNSTGNDDGLGIGCRDSRDGNNNHYAMWLYPNRNPATTDNLILVRHFSNGSITTLATGRFPELQNQGAGSANSVTLRLDCLGTHITAYYQIAGNLKPMLSASDTSLTTNYAASYFSFGVGPGGVTQLHTRMSALTIKSF